MFAKRLKIFMALSAAFLLVCVLRLVQMQLLENSYYAKEVARLTAQGNKSRRLKTVRGRILDRKGRTLAVDEPRFYLHIDYGLSRFLDERVRRAALLSAARRRDRELATAAAQRQISTALEQLKTVIDRCARLGAERTATEQRIRQINDAVWNLREYLAWKRNYPGTASFARAVADPNERLLLTRRVDITEMHKPWPLLELQTQDDIFTALFEFRDIDDVRVLAQPHRVYPYDSVAAQTIGWVGPAVQQRDTELFAGDRLRRYLRDETCGRAGVEYLCEPVLRGARGEEIYDIDGELVRRTEKQFGTDVRLTLDIELQKQIEQYLSDFQHDPNCGPGTAAVVIDVDSAQILAMVSLPTFNLNRARYDYGRLIKDPYKPMLNRATSELYPPGSVVKPLILVAGLESGKVGADEIISCPAHSVPAGWPNCWIFNRYRTGHDAYWLNNARNAIRGSCNVYFSRLADRIDPAVLQQWLFKFGYGRTLLSVPVSPQNNEYLRNFRQAAGIISSSTPRKRLNTLEQWQQYPIEKRDRRWFGIGQGNLRVTVLQVANAMAAIARGGVFAEPRLFIEDANDAEQEGVDLGISPQTLKVIQDGMHAVVNETNGTAHSEFSRTDFGRWGVEVYGKTGSTQAPENAWFAGFAKDRAGRCVALAVVVEGGQSGARDAAPLARNIIQFSINAGYIGPGEAASKAASGGLESRP